MKKKKWKEKIFGEVLLRISTMESIYWKLLESFYILNEYLTADKQIAIQSRMNIHKRY